MLRRVILLSLIVFVLVACGIKAPPKAPLATDAPPPVEVLDAGCCREPR
ncbi:MAG: hypothetical protein IAE78_13630 [Myxococcus sp.]|nr:hypothetical protein [Myxococcus sp.]